MYAQRLKAMWKDVQLVVFAAQEHAFFATNPLTPASDELLHIMKRFTASRPRGLGLDIEPAQLDSARLTTARYDNELAQLKN